MKKSFEDFGISISHNASGPEVYTTCPQCSASRRKKNAKCLSVNIDSEVWFCAHCGWAGCLKSGEDRKANANWWKPKAYRKPVFVPQTPEDRVYGWFAKRGISKPTLDRVGVSYGKAWMPQVEDYVGTIQFPFKRGGEVINVKYRDGQKNFRQERDCERVLFGLDDLAETTIIVEGEIDKLSLDEAGLTNSVSVPDGAPAPDAKNYASKFDFIENCEKDMEVVKTWIIAVDSDAPGATLQEELVRRLGSERCKLVVWPEDCKDANEVLTKHGKNKLLECISQAKPCPISGIYDVLSLEAQIVSLYRQGADRGVDIGWRNMRDMLRVRPGEWSVVTGIPGSGKSEWLDATILNLAQKHGWRFGIFSPENQPLAQHFAKLAEKYIGLPFFDGPTPRMEPEDMHRAAVFTQEHFHFILPGEEDGWGLDDVLGLASALVTRQGIRGLVIDPWNEIEHVRPGSMTEPEYISLALTKVRRWARKHGVHVWLVAHPTKLRKNDDGSYPVPTPYDISGAAHWRNKADYAIAVHRPDQRQNMSEVHVQKVRFKSLGRLGVARFTWDKVTGRYTEVYDVQRDEDVD